MVGGRSRVCVVDPAVVGDRLRLERLRRGITQNEAAALLGVSRRTYRQLEIWANPQLLTLLDLADAGFDLRRIVPELFVV